MKIKAKGGHFPRLTVERDKLSFYIISSSHDLLAQMDSLIRQQGLIGVMDAAGNVKYMVEGRKGSPYAMRQIDQLTRRIIEENDLMTDEKKNEINQAINKVLNRHYFRQILKGYSFLKVILRFAMYDQTLLHPLSKSMYPLIAKHFKVRLGQVERNLRYLFDCLKDEESKFRALIRIGVIDQEKELLHEKDTAYSNREAIYYLYQKVLQEYSERNLKQKG